MQNKYNFTTDYSIIFIEERIELHYKLFMIWQKLDF